jgi:DNA helicase-2/ATP-dependent DNA helicase PcrA
MHSAKGLEFKYVFCVHMNNGVFPSLRSIDNNSVEEERRLAYVAFTRAKEQLYILSHTHTQNPYLNGEKSIFIEEMSNHFNNRDFSFLDNVVKDTSQNITSKVFDGELRAGDQVFHDIFKNGIIININENVAKVAFKDAGIKTIKIEYLTKI